MKFASRAAIAAAMMLIAACRMGQCRDFHQEIAIKLPVRNQRVVAVTAPYE